MSVKSGLLVLCLGGGLMLGGAVVVPPEAAAEEVTIGSGSRAGPFYGFGRTICRVLKRQNKEMDCSVLPTPKGDAAESYANLINVRNGTMDIVLARSDWLHFAVKKTGRLKHVTENFESLRTLFTIHSQPLTLIARADAGIAKLDDLKGKRINIGKPLSEDRATMELLLKAQKWSRGDFVVAEELTAEQQSLAFCHDRLQVIYYVATHPNQDVNRVLSLCNGVLVDVSGPGVEALVKETPYMSATRVPAGTYPGVDKPVGGFGAKVALVSSADVDEELVYTFVKSVFENLDALKNAHPALRDLDPATMIEPDLAAPLHPGAERYFRERGLM